MSPYFESYLTVVAFPALGVVLFLGILGVASLLWPDNPTIPGVDCPSFPMEAKSCIWYISASLGTPATA